MHEKRPESMESRFPPRFGHTFPARSTQPVQKARPQIRIAGSPFRQFTAVPRKRRAVVTEMVSHRNIARRYAILHPAEKRPQHKQTDTEIFRFILPGHNFARSRLIAVDQIAQPLQQHARQLIVFPFIVD